MSTSGHTDRITGIAFSPDETQFATSSQDGSIILWDFATGNPIQRYVGHTDRIYDIAFSPIDSQFISAGWDRELRLWDAYNGAQIQRFNHHADDVYAVALHPDETIAASASVGITLLYCGTFKQEKSSIT